MREVCAIIRNVVGPSLVGAALALIFRAALSSGAGDRGPDLVAASLLLFLLLAAFITSRPDRVGACGLGPVRLELAWNLRLSGSSPPARARTAATPRVSASRCGA